MVQRGPEAPLFLIKINNATNMAMGNESKHHLVGLKINKDKTRKMTNESITTYQEVDDA